jgi:hypothetical protein
MSDTATLKRLAATFVRMQTPRPAEWIRPGQTAAAGSRAPSALAEWIHLAPT